MRERQKSVRGRPRNAGRAVLAFDDSMSGDSSSSYELEFEIGIGVFSCELGVMSSELGVVSRELGVAERGWRRRPGPHESTFAGPMDF